MTSIEQPNSDPAEQWISRLPIDRFIGVRVLLAISGGADSTAMLRLVHQAWSEQPDLSVNHLSVAHFNHALRGVESDHDESFVISLSQSLGLACHSQRVAHEQPARDEQSLRTERYRFLQQTAERIGARYVMVAHHRDDNIETFVHNLLRGSGLAGLSGMRPNRELGPDVVLYRPLLDVPQAALRQWLTTRGYQWREDQSNQSTHYRRNWIRHTLLPLLQAQYPQSAESIERTIEQQVDVLFTLQRLAHQWIETQVRFTAGSVSIDRAPLDRSLIGLVVREVWDRQSWPRQALSQPHLHQLWQAIQPASSDLVTASLSFHLPGRLRVQSTAGQSLTITSTLT